MDFRTTIKTSPLISLDYDQSFVMLGSCFADNMGARLSYYGFNGSQNPFGVLYNPSSIAGAIRHILAKKTYTIKDLFHHNGLYGSFDFHGSFSRSDADEAASGMNTSINKAYQYLTTCSTLFITWGSAWVYEKEGKIVSNCHKFPEKQFSTRRLSIQEIVTDYTELIQQLRAINPQLKIVFTVSPIRYMKHGATDNQRNKAILHLAIEELCAMDKQNLYFPAYELLNDDLRDYRFYADDMIHPSPLAISYIWERFVESCISPKDMPTMKEVESIRRRKAHRPLHPDSPTYAIFVKTLEKDIEKLTTLYPTIQL